jgi:hypothetical protein
MTTVIVGMLLVLLLSLGVVALVAVPARRQGRELLTPEGEALVQSARERTVGVVGAARDRVADLTDKLPGSRVDSEQDVDLRPASREHSHRAG